MLSSTHIYNLINVNQNFMNVKYILSAKTYNTFVHLSYVVIFTKLSALKNKLRKKASSVQVQETTLKALLMPVLTLVLKGKFSCHKRHLNKKLAKLKCSEKNSLKSF